MIFEARVPNDKIKIIKYIEDSHVFNDFEDTYLFYLKVRTLFFKINSLSS